MAQITMLRCVNADRERVNSLVCMRWRTLSIMSWRGLTEKALPTEGRHVNHDRVCFCARETDESRRSLESIVIFREYSSATTLSQLPNSHPCVYSQERLFLFTGCGQNPARPQNHAFRSFLTCMMRATPLSPSRHAESMSAKKIYIPTQTSQCTNLPMTAMNSFHSAKIQPSTDLTPRHPARNRNKKSA